MYRKLIFLVLTMCLTVSVAGALDVPIRINCGASDDIDDGDKVWIAGDPLLTPGHEGANWTFGDAKDLSFADDPGPQELYVDCYHKKNWCNRDEYTEHDIDIPDGSYLVRFHLFDNNAAQRYFDIIIEDEIVLDDFDAQARAKELGHASGVHVIVIEEVEVKVSDGDGMQIRDMGGGPDGCSDSWVGAIEILSGVQSVIPSRKLAVTWGSLK